MGPNEILCSNNSRLEGKSISNASVVTISAVICFARQRDNIMILLFYGNGTLVRDIYHLYHLNLSTYSKGKGMESLSTANEDSREPV